MSTCGEHEGRVPDGMVPGETGEVAAGNECMNMMKKHPRLSIPDIDVTSCGK